MPRLDFRPAGSNQTGFAVMHVGEIMQITRLYTNSDGDSAFEDLQLSLERAGAERFASLGVPSSMVVNETVGGSNFSV